MRTSFKAFYFSFSVSFSILTYILINQWWDYLFESIFDVITNSDDSIDLTESTLT